MATEQTPKKGRGRLAKTTDGDIAAYKARIATLARKLEESNTHKRSWENKCNELWEKNDFNEKKINELLETIKSEKRAYERLVRITQSLCKSLYSASDALNTIQGGF